MGVRPQGTISAMEGAAPKGRKESMEGCAPGDDPYAVSAPYGPRPENLRVLTKSKGDRTGDFSHAFPTKFSVE
jgi:hypothetical protein